MSAFAARYARAFADVVHDEKLDLAQVQQQLEDFAATFAGSKNLKDVLLNPAMSVKQRVAVLDAVNRRAGMGPKVRNFLAVLIDHGRLGALDEILEQYQVEMSRRSGISAAEVLTARRLEDQERTALESQVAGLAGTEVHATFREDASLIGGAIVRVGSTIYDGSVRGRLERMRSRLAAS